MFLGKDAGGFQLSADMFDFNFLVLTGISDGHVSDTHVSHLVVCPAPPFAPIIDGSLVIIVDQCGFFNDMHAEGLQDQAQGLDKAHKFVEGLDFGLTDSLTLTHFSCVSFQPIVSF
jgi:hypothetical protein